ncbi:hypothetical protein AcW2_007579 [Taiwanofungus camphoratus]|nr:hypothetical protein AcW2_007579 [Antrodia cinnamomea]
MLTPRRAITMWPVESARPMMSSRRVCRTEDELGAIEANMPLLFLPLFVNAREPAGQVVHTCAGSVDGVLDSQIKNAGNSKAETSREMPGFHVTASYDFKGVLAAS